MEAPNSGNQITWWQQSIPTPKIITGELNKVFHDEGDNIENETTNIHGINIISNAGGILLQAVKKGSMSESDWTLLLIGRKSNTRFFKIEPPEFPLLLSFKRIVGNFMKFQS